MAMSVARPYACPKCMESFTKWGLCLSHIRGTELCRTHLEAVLQDVDTLQEQCRESARLTSCNPGLPPALGAEGDAAGSFAQATALESSSMSSGATNWSAGQHRLPHAGEYGDTVGVSGIASTSGQSLPSASSRFTTSSAASKNGHVICGEALRLLDKAVRKGRLFEKDRTELDECLSDVARHTAKVQVMTIQKFLSPGVQRLRWIYDKKSWLGRCLTFCARNGPDDSASEIKEHLNRGSLLVDALSEQALTPSVLLQAHWDRFLELSDEVQRCVVSAVRSSLLANASLASAEVFEHICYNERAIYIRQAAGPPEVDIAIQQVEWQAVDRKPYQRLMRHMVVHRNLEERVLRELAAIDINIHPGGEGSLLRDHLATRDARNAGSAEVLSLLHAAASCGLVRVCARLLAEGLEVNERAGHSGQTPLHLAAVRGEVEVLRLLLDRQGDANRLDGEGHTPLFVAIQAAAQLRLTPQEGGGGLTPSHRSLQFRACALLLEAGAENSAEGFADETATPISPEALALQHGLWSLARLIRLHDRIRALRARFPTVDDASIGDLLQLRYETACFVILLLERAITVTPDAVPTEFRAIISSEFVQERDRIMIMGSKLYLRMPLLKKRAIDALVNLPYDAAVVVLRTWHIEEVSPGEYTVPDRLNLLPPPPPPGPPPPPADLDTAFQNGLEADVNQVINGESAPEAAPSVSPHEGLPIYDGRVRKWDSERGFGFIVQDSVNGEEGIKDIFVHRKNVAGSTASNHIDLRENCRVRFRLSLQDGRPRALETTMLDSSGKSLQIHGRSGKADGSTESQGGASPSRTDEKPAEFDVNVGDASERVTLRFLRHLRHPEVQRIVADRRVVVDSWLRCVGLKRHHSGRRDDAMWKKEIDRRVDVFLSRSTTPLQKKDFDYRVRRFLMEICVQSSVARVSDALAMVEATTGGKGREQVRSWPAYLATLLKRFDPRLHEVLSERDKRRNRDDAKSSRSVGISASSAAARSTTDRPATDMGNDEDVASCSSDDALTSEAEEDALSDGLAKPEGEGELCARREYRTAPALQGGGSLAEGPPQPQQQPSYRSFQ